MRRYRTIRRFVKRQATPSIRHKNPDTPLPIECCRCDRCEDARADQEGDRIELAMGQPEDQPETDRR